MGGGTTHGLAEMTRVHILVCASHVYAFPIVCVASPRDYLSCFMIYVLAFLVEINALELKSSCLSFFKTLQFRNARFAQHLNEASRVVYESEHRELYTNQKSAVRLMF